MRWDAGPTKDMIDTLHVARALHFVRARDQALCGTDRPNAKLHLMPQRPPALDFRITNWGPKSEVCLSLQP